MVAHIRVACQRIPPLTLIRSGLADNRWSSRLALSAGRRFDQLQRRPVANTQIHPKRMISSGDSAIYRTVQTPLLPQVMRAYLAALVYGAEIML